MAEPSRPAEFESQEPVPGMFSGIVAMFAVAVLGLFLILVAVLMPAGWRTIDPAVLAAAGRGTETLFDAEKEWLDAGKPGVAHLFAEAHELIEEEPYYRIFVEEVEGGDRFPEVWGGNDPYLEQVFGRDGIDPEEERPPVLPLFLSGESREALGAFLGGSRNPAVQAVLGNRRVEGGEELMPVGTAAGQPLEATVYLVSLLLQGNHLSREFAGEIRRLAEDANEENRLGEIEPVYLDFLTLGSFLQWQALVEISSLFEGREDLRRSAHLFRVLGGEGVVFAAAALWVESPGEVGGFLIGSGRAGLEDLKEAMLLGRGAVALLAERQLPVSVSAVRSLFPEGIPVVWERVSLVSPIGGVILKSFLLLGGIWLLVFGLGGFRRLVDDEGGGFGEGEGGGIRFLRSFLVAVVAVALLFIFVEPILPGGGQTTEFRLQFAVPVVSGETAAVSADEGISMKIDQVTTLSILVFFVIQLVLYFICWLKLAEIRRQRIAGHLKLQLLENEDHLFDSGLYVGLAGTVAGLILLALGVVDLGLMAAYASTLFGIVFVAAFKIFHLRPYRRALIVREGTER